jgi:hypothetical protein
MNERIKQLAEQAETYADYYAMLSETGEKEIFIKKFADLIVKECAGVCEDYRGTEWGKAAECIGDSIKEHFGVEE